MSWLDPATIGIVLQILLIDLTLAGDNAIVVALVAARVSERERSRVVFWGIAGATGMRIGFAILATYFLHVIGLTLAGGLLLLWVVWKLFRELRVAAHHPQEPGGLGGREAQGLRPLAAMSRIVLADLSMSLDNVLAVAGIARDHIWLLAAGLGLSVALMGLGSTLVTRMLGRLPWLSWLGLGVIACVALRMIWEGGFEVEHALPWLNKAV